MQINRTAMGWATAILATALLAISAGLSDAASFALITCLSGAALGSLKLRRSGCC